MHLYLKLTGLYFRLVALGGLKLYFEQYANFTSITLSYYFLEYLLESREKVSAFRDLGNSANREKLCFNSSDSHVSNHSAIQASKFKYKY